MIKLFLIKLIMMSLKGSLIGILILFLRRIFNKIPNILYSFFWLVFVLVLVVPVNIPSRLSIRNLITNPVAISIEDTKTSEIINQPIVDENYSHEVVIPKSNEDRITMPNRETIVPEESSTISHSSIVRVNMWDALFIIWALVVISFIIKDAVILCHAKKEIKKNSVIGSEYDSIYERYNMCKSNLNIRKNIKLILQNKISSPALVGILKPQVIATPQVRQLDALELNYIFTHELMHYKKKDHLIYVILNTIKYIYWFNPIVRFIIKNIKEDIEYTTDRLVVNHLSDTKEYLKVLVKFTQMNNHRYVATLGIGSDKKGLERRIKMLKKNQIFSFKTISTFVLLAITILCFTVSLTTNAIVSTENSTVAQNNSIDDIYENIQDDTSSAPSDKVNNETQIPINNISTEKKNKSSINVILNGKTHIFSFTNNYGSQNYLVMSIDGKNIEGIKYNASSEDDVNNAISSASVDRIIDLKTKSEYALITYEILESQVITIVGENGNVLLNRDVILYIMEEQNFIVAKLMSAGEIGTVVSWEKYFIENGVLVKENHEGYDLEESSSDETQPANDIETPSENNAESKKENTNINHSENIVNTDHAYYFPLKNLNDVVISNPFGVKELNMDGKVIASDFHDGIDFARAGYKAPIYAAHDGTVVKKEYDNILGYYLAIDHHDGYYTLYAHMNNFASDIKVGDTVSAKQVIGYVGSTGASTGPHLHFEVHKDGSIIDPMSLNLLNW